MSFGAGHVQDMNNRIKQIEIEIEKEIAKLMTTGQSDKEIAGNLDIPVRTVQHHVRSILKKADSENRIKFALSFAI